jgi:phage shock protein A
MLQHVVKAEKSNMALEQSTQVSNPITRATPMNEIELKQQKVAKIVKIGVLLVVCAVLGPLAYLAIKGIVGLAAFGALVFIGYNAAPVIALKVANAKYRAIDDEKISHIKKVERTAAENPIETATAQSQAYKARAAKYLEGITAYGTEVNNFETMTADFSKKYPETAPRYKEQLATMKKALAYKNDKYRELVQNIKLMDDKIQFLAANWKMSQALQKVNALGGVDGSDPMEQVKADAAIDAVVNSINRAFAEMDASVLADSVAKGGTTMNRADLLTNTPSPSLPGIDSIEAPTSIKTLN